MLPPSRALQGVDRSALARLAGQLALPAGLADEAAGLAEAALGARAGGCGGIPGRVLAGIALLAAARQAGVPLFLVEVAAALDMSVFVFGRAFKYALDALGLRAPPPPAGAYVRRVAAGLRPLAQPALRVRGPATPCDAERPVCGHACKRALLPRA
jgi:transcription initiation factor TFIIIB Brf1 subunit/transcription initiation factor TFIIB